MRKGQDRKVKVARSGSAWVGRLAGRASCLGLLALGLALVNPVGCLSAFAEGEGNVVEEVAGEVGEVEEVEDYGIDTQVLTASTVRISFSPVAGTAVAPVGVPTKFQVTATVDVEHSGGYTVYFGSNSQNLTRVGGTETIAPITGSVDFDNLENDTWGYALAEGTTVPDTATYTAVPGSVKGRAVYTNNSTKIIKESKTYTLSFVARIGTSKPAGTYQNEVTMSVVSSPAQLALGDISEMQQMTSDICENTATNASKQLKDVRDGKYYWVSKLADGKCWMTQNLDLDLNTDTLPLTAVTSDVEGDWTPSDAGKDPAYTATVATADTIYASYLGQRSWDLGDYRITNPNTLSDCGYPRNSAIDCKSQLTAYETPQIKKGIEPVLGDINAHYILGNHYQWDAATAGTGKTTTEEVAESSICSKGWRLPTGNPDSGEFEVLVAALGGTSSVNNVTKAPFYGSRSGYVFQTTPYLFTAAGSLGYYWSSTLGSDVNLAYVFIFGGANLVDPSRGDGRAVGFSVRCIAR